MNKRYQVFVSSTYEDLKDERAKVITALLNIDCIPCGMEYFPAADEDAWQSIERLIPQCDYYVVIVAGMYGSIPSRGTKSYTHMEYELAIKSQVPVLALLHRDISALPQAKCETDLNRRKKLERFRQQVGKKLCRFWMSPDQITGELLASLKQQMDRCPRIGWVRGDSVANDEAKTEIISLRRLVERQREEIEVLHSKEIDENSNLANGEDVLILRGGFNHTGLRTHGLKSWEFTMETTWDAIIKFIRNKHPESWTDSSLAHSIDDCISKIIENGSDDLDEFYYRCPLVYDADVKKISIQLNALGLISRTRDKWYFNQKGLNYSSKILALKKGEYFFEETNWFSIEKISPVLFIE